ncbi:MAG TPA: DUF5682 family protein, partial [Acidimicrobiales bacterium]|nr:DUF5682 family protein [Acidimicrobiales bacterium]
MADVAEVVVLGIRHHGPGSARAVVDALDQVRPDVVLIEGAPELDAVVALMASPGMRPPVAGLVYAPEETRRAAFYPMAVFSPEWVAARWALRHGVDVHFADLPAAHQLALDHHADHDDHDDGDDDDDGPPLEGPDDDRAAAEPGDPGVDPISVLAAAAGFDDPERWWEDAVEHRRGGLGRFVAVA